MLKQTRLRLTGQHVLMPTSRKRKKRARTVDGDEAETPTHALFSCYDAPDELVEVELSLVEHFGARLAAVVRNSAPTVDKAGRPVWRAGMTRPMLLTLLKSLTLGQLVLCKGVTVGEALATLDHECITVTGGPQAAPSVELPCTGVAHAKHQQEGRVQLMTRLCESVADALVLWPRLEAILDTATRSNAQHFSSTSTRLWVRFSDRPKQQETGSLGYVEQLCHKMPRWFAESLISVGVAHYRLSSKDALFGAMRDQAAFKKLTAEIEADPLGCFFGVRNDCYKKAADSRLRKEITRGEAFANEIRKVILDEAVAEHSHNAPKPLRVQYAEAIVTFVENVMVETPVCAVKFSNACADEKGATPERLALAKALRTRKVRLLRWADEREPNIKALVFPPNWREGTHSTCYGPAVLLDFEKLR